MFKSRSGPRALVALAGTVAIVVAACSAVDRDPRPQRRRGQAAVVSAAPERDTRARPRSSPPAPVDASVPGPNGGQIIRWFVGLGAGGQPQQIAGADRLRHQVQQRPREQGQGVHLARDLRQQGRGQHPQDADRRRQRAGHHRPGRRRGPEPVHRPAGRPAAADRLDRLRHEQVPGRDEATSSRSARAARRSACRSAPTRRSSGTTRSCSTRPSSPYPPTKVGDLYQGKPWDMDAVRDAGHEAHRRQERQRRHQRRLRPRRTSSSGASTPVGRQQPAGRDSRSSAPARSSPTTARRPRSRTPCGPAINWFNDGVWKDHFIPTQNAGPQRPAGQGQRVRSRATSR